MTAATAPAAAAAAVETAVETAGEVLEAQPKIFWYAVAVGAAAIVAALLIRHYGQQLLTAIDPADPLELDPDAVEVEDEPVGDPGEVGY